MLEIDKIRNFAIIAHVDHGKSTLADRMLEITETVPKRSLQQQTLDSMELERERGITIKMAPAKMKYKGYTLNLIDTPGHIDFSYEVSRALSAIEGVVLLVDATQGIQAQTLSTLSEAKKQGLVIVPAISKVDAPLARVDDVRAELALELNCDEEDIILTSGKTGEGVEDLLNAIIEKIPAPEKGESEPRALIFDFQYSDHRGIILYVRVFDGEFKRGETYKLSVAKEEFKALEVGIFKPEETSADSLTQGDIGYIITGIKKPGIAQVGDTVLAKNGKLQSLPGFMQVKPVIWASVYPESQDDLTLLKQALEKLRLSDSALSYEEESSGMVGRGFRLGFLGMLHMEIITERLKREFGLSLIVTLPAVSYKVVYKTGEEKVIYAPMHFPDESEVESVYEKWADMTVILPPEYLGSVMQILHDHEADVKETETMPDGRARLSVELPLRELMRNLFDKIKNVSSGFASISYKVSSWRLANVVRMDVLIAEEVSPAFTRVISKQRIRQEAEAMVERLDEVLPRQQFVLKIQAKVQGKIVASRKKSALRKDVTAKLYGGDVTRKMKLLEKQKKGKKKMLSRGKVHIPNDVFLKVLRKER